MAMNTTVDADAPELLIPDNDVADPEVTILIPALNESITIAEFVDWCHEGLAEAGAVGEILIVDSSQDDTAKIALQHGARVLKVPKRGLGRAYLDGVPFARGKYLILGDCDLTYDFRLLSGFVDKMRKGADFVMGSRFAGYIEDGSMPALHRYFGTPLTTWILNRLYGTRYTDIHCGMRGVSKAAFYRMGLKSQSWEYASEMVLKAAKLGMKIEEIPVRFYKDREGRLSHHKRSGWFSPWQAGWINLRVMLLHAPDYFLLKPGLACWVIGLVMSFITAFFQPHIGPLAFNLHWLFFFICLTLCGMHAMQLGLMGKVWHDYKPEETAAIKKRFTYNRGMFLGGAQMLVGLGLIMPMVLEYLFSWFSLTDIHYIGLFGGLLLVMGFETLGFTILFVLLLNKTKEADKSVAVPEE